MVATGPHVAEGEVCKSRGEGGGGANMLTGTLGLLRAPAGKNKLEGLAE